MPTRQEQTRTEAHDTSLKKRKRWGDVAGNEEHSLMRPKHFTAGPALNEWLF
jgi:hypothetical protein